MNLLKSVCIVLLLFATCYLLLATQVYAGSVGTSTALFLQEIPSVRLQGMAGVSAGAGEDIASIYSNPSGLGLFTQKGLSLSLWSGFIPESRYYFAGFVYPTRFAPASARRAKKINFGLSYLGYTAGEEEIVEFDLSSRKIKLEQDTVLTLSFGRYLPLNDLPLKNLSLKKIFSGNFYTGMNLKYINSKLAEDYSANTFTTDWAIVWNDLKKKISLTASVQNLFGKLKYKNVADPLPTNIRIGGTYAFQLKNDRFLLVLDLVKPNDDQWKQLVGIEYYPLEISSIRLRAGIGRQRKMNLFGLGFGLKMGKVDIDYAYSGTGEKDNPIRNTLHRISFTMKFGLPIVLPKRVNQIPKIGIQSAGQQLSTTTVRVTYVVIDPDTDTVKVNLFYEDAGSTNTCKTISGEIGLVSTGTIHTAYWDAKTDFNEQETNIRMYIQVDDLEGATTSIYTDSFPLDTKAPVGKGLTFVNQPVAGDSSIMLQCDWEDPVGSIENISTVQFAYRKNDADYSPWIDGSQYAGTVFRVLDNRVGTLAGNDYFNAIKSQAIDKYGNLAEPVYNPTEKLVRPAVPNPPEISAVYFSSITLIINPAEIIVSPPGLYCAIRATYTLAGADFEKWVDTNKNLSASSPVFQSIEPTGWNGSTITVSGLEPATTYYFSIIAGNPRMGKEPFTGAPPESSLSPYSLTTDVLTQTLILPTETPKSPEILIPKKE